MKKESYKKYTTLVAVTMMVTFLFPVFKFDLARAVIQGPCGNCHTMHNSQDNLPMNYPNNFDTQSQPNDTLLRASCLGCHAQGSTALVNFGPDMVPQVYHTELANNLAGGNFIYVENSPANGHNIVALTGLEDVLQFAPGSLTIRSDHYGDDGIVTNDNLTCSSEFYGQNGGCHGIRGSTDENYWGIKGAHHDNRGSGSWVEPDSTFDREPGHSYRFLVGVRGYEAADWEYGKTIGSHNEYYGRPSPALLQNCSRCHGIGNYVRPENGSISFFCATCHGNFHTLRTTRPNDDGIGDDIVSPFIRHPTDVVLPIEGEYASYTTYNLQAPVARPTTYNTPSSTVTPGTDIVMCLSCHYSHGGEYSDMLRWSYGTMIAGGGGSGGCFVCHSTKN